MNLFDVLTVKYKPRMCNDLASTVELHGHLAKGGPLIEILTVVINWVIRGLG